MAEILYRKWRPRTFSELAGQEHVATTLINALGSGRIAHAYLFCGPRGTGKTSTGRLLAKALNCTDRENGEPCNRCDSCQAFSAGRALDLIELDAASNRGIDEIRSLRDKVAFAPGAGQYKVYLIDEVHMLTDAAFNALLKTLEEPPPHVVFILATTEVHRLPATIASRCQRFDFRRAPLPALVKNLQRICEGEGFSCSTEALELIGRSATGSHRDAVNLLDQLVTSYGRELTVEHVRAGLGLLGDERSARLARLALAGDLAGGLTLIASVRDDGLDLRQFQRELVEELRTLLMVKLGSEPPQGVTAERLAELQAAVAEAPTTRILAALKAFGEADLKTDPNSTLPLDIALAECLLAREDARPVSMPDRTATAVEAPSRSAQPAARRPTAASPPPAPPQAAAVLPPREEPAPVASAWESPNDVTPPPETPGEPVKLAATLEGLRAGMRVIYQKARERSPQLGALLNSGCDIIAVDGRGILFGFRHAVHAEKASDKRNLETLKAVIFEVTQQEMAITCQVKQDIEDWKQRDSVSRSHLVRAAQQMGARILSTSTEEPA